MEKCKFCQADLAENGTFCPNCGRNNAEEEIVTEETVPVAEETPEETTPVEETAAEEVSAEEEIPAEEVSAEETPVEEVPEKKATPTKIALAVAAVVVLIAVMVGIYFATRPETVEGAKTITVLRGADSADFALANGTHKLDLLISSFRQI